MHGVWDMQLLKDDQLELEAIVTFALGNDCFIALPTEYAKSAIYARSFCNTWEQNFYNWMVNLPMLPKHFSQSLHKDTLGWLVSNWSKELLQGLLCFLATSSMQLLFFLKFVGRDRQHNQQILSIQRSQHAILSRDYYCKEHMI